MTGSPPPKDPVAVMKAILAAVEARADHFTLLQVPRQVEPSQLRDAYFRLAKIVHPDLPAFAGNPALRNEATRAFQAITSANSTLADPSRRKAYMLQLMQAAIDRAETTSEGLQARAVQTAAAQPMSAVPVQRTQTVAPVQATQQTQAAPVMTAQQQAVRTTVPQQQPTSQFGAVPQPGMGGISAPGSVSGPPLNRTGVNAMVGQPPSTARHDFTVPPRQESVVPGRVTGGSPILSTGTFSSLARTGSRPVVVEDINSGRRTSSHTIARAQPSTGPVPTATTATNRPIVAGSVPPGLTATGQFQPPQFADPGARPPSGVFAPITGPQTAGSQFGATGQFTRPTGTMPIVSPTPSGLVTTQQGLVTPAANTVLTSTGQFPRPTPGPQALVPDTAPQSVRAPSTTRGLEPPPNAEVARIYMHTGRQQLNRRDWAGAQEALELALPLLENKEMADCKVMLGWAIFNNNANPEEERIERPKKMWAEVVTQFPKSPFHAQSAYYLAVWHKLHGELRHVMSNLQQCLDLQPNHIEAAREKRLMEARRSNLAELKELEEREKAAKTRRASSTATPVGKPTPAVVKKVALPKEQSWLEKMFGGGASDDKKKK